MFVKISCTVLSRSSVCLNLRNPCSGLCDITHSSYRFSILFWKIVRVSECRQKVSTAICFSISSISPCKDHRCRKVQLHTIRTKSFGCSRPLSTASPTTVVLICWSARYIRKIRQTRSCNIEEAVLKSQLNFDQLALGDFLLSVIPCLIINGSRESHYNKMEIKYSRGRSRYRGL